MEDPFKKTDSGQQPQFAFVYHLQKKLTIFKNMNYKKVKYYSKNIM